MFDLLIARGDALTMDPARRIVPNTAVAVKAGRIACCAAGQDVDTAAVGGEVLMQGRKPARTDECRPGETRLLKTPAGIWGQARFLPA